MAQRFISGLYHRYPSSEGGRWISRLLIEWLTQVVKWPTVDLISAGGKWNNVLASGTATAETISSTVIAITSGTAITSSHVNWFLTITGFAGADAKYDGIYKIKRIISAVGGVYTIEVWPYGVHHNGFPVQSGLDWRLWAGTDTYCPTTASEIAVLTGTGHTGAGLSNGARSLVTLSITQVSTTSTLTDSGATFLDSDVGKKITVSGSSDPNNNGTFTILTRESAIEITYTNADGSTDASFTGSWAITYDYHWYYICDNSNGLGSSRIAPYASWDKVAHTWAVGDSRYTAALGMSGGTEQDIENMWIWAEADCDHFTLAAMTDTSWGDSVLRVYSTGELTSFSAVEDPRAIWMWCAFNVCSSYYNPSGVPYQIEPRPTLGYGYPGPYYIMYDKFRGLSYDDITTLTYYAMSAHSLASSDSNMYWNPYRVLSKYSNKAYLSPINLESRTAGHMELRGSLRHLYICNSHLPVGYPFGVSGEYLHLPIRGVVIPWNGSTLLSNMTAKSAVG